MPDLQIYFICMNKLRPRDKKNKKKKKRYKEKKKIKEKWEERIKMGGGGRNKRRIGNDSTLTIELVLPNLINK